MAAASVLSEGSLIEGFRIGKKLHDGGMSTLWQVTHDDIAVPLLMKIPTLIDGNDPATIVGFEMEQMILPLLHGVHVPKVFASGEFGALPFIVMEQIEGQSLLPKLDASPLPAEEVRAIGSKIAVALDDLHHQHVIHLDIKPSNVMYRPTGEAVLIDFGLAHHEELPDLLSEELRLPIGTGPYISPEQLRRDRTDPRSDIFSLGVLLYHLVTRQRPFGYPRNNHALRKRLWRDPLPLRAIDPHCPLWLQEIVLRCLEPDPDQRYPTAAHVAFDLKHPDEVRLTERAERLQKDPFLVAAGRWYKMVKAEHGQVQTIARRMSQAPIVMVAIDLDDGTDSLSGTLRDAVQRVLESSRGVRLACVSVLKLNRVALDYALDNQGRSIHVMRLIQLKEWARPLHLGTGQVTYHVLEAADPAAVLIDYASTNHVDQILIGANARFTQRGRLGGVATNVVAEAPCTVTVVRSRATDDG